MAKKAKRSSKAPVKPTVKKRSLNAGPPVKKKPGEPKAPSSEQDVQRRLGNFTTAGEPARSGRRGS
jgi:hypothetical protein